jgi:hypothetical protein
VNNASINFIAFSDAGMPSVVVLAGAGVQPNQASGFRVQIGMTVSSLDMRTQNLSGVLLMYKGGVCMPPQMPGAKHA